MPEKDPAHWLYRLDPGEWLAAAATELAAAEAALSRRSFRTGITHARRAAGMALNAPLWQGEHPSWGRSYMEHVIALIDEPAAPEPVRQAAALLRTTPPEAPALVSLARPGQMGERERAVIEATRTIMDWAKTTTAVVTAPLS
jgi:DNA polymerase IIIc chi subunit